MSIEEEVEVVEEATEDKVVAAEVVATIKEGISSKKEVITKEVATIKEVAVVVEEEATNKSTSINHTNHSITREEADTNLGEVVEALEGVGEAILNRKTSEE
jgi:hypothetical protein